MLHPVVSNSYLENHRRGSGFGRSTAVSQKPFLCSAPWLGAEHKERSTVDMGLVLSSGRRILLLGQSLGTRVGSPHCTVTHTFFLGESKQVSKDFCLALARPTQNTLALPEQPFLKTTVLILHFGPNQPPHVMLQAGAVWLERCPLEKVLAVLVNSSSARASGQEGQGGCGQVGSAS